MKVTNVRGEFFSKFGNLNIGDTFMYFGNLYVKMESFVNIHTNFNALDLKKTSTFYFGDDTEVTKVDCEVIIK